MTADADKQSAELHGRYGPYADISGMAEATLVVGLVDAKTDKSVWLGAARALAFPERQDAQWSRAHLHTALTAIFESWKPGRP